MVPRTNLLTLIFAATLANRPSGARNSPLAEHARWAALSRIFPFMPGIVAKEDRRLH
jgi:hypothetical protein